MAKKKEKEQEEEIIIEDTPVQERKYEIIALAVSLDRNKVAKHGEIIKHDEFVSRSVAALLKGNFIKEVE